MDHIDGEIIDAIDAKYYILKRELYRIRVGEVIPAAWNNGLWERKPFAFELEATAHMISKEEADEWIRIHPVRKRWKASL